MYPFGGILIAPLVAGYLASVLCRVQRHRERRPGFAILLLAIIAGVLASWLSMFQLDLFSPARWSNSGKVQMWMLLLISGIPSLFVSTIAATVFVTRHRRIFDETHPVAELPPRLSARHMAAIRTRGSRSTLRFRRQSLSFAFGVLVMGTHSQTPARAETAAIVAFAVSWILLHSCFDMFRLPIPPYRLDPAASLGIQVVAYAWAVLLLMLPLLLPLMAGHLAARRWAGGRMARLSAFAVLALALIPLVVIACSTLMTIANPAGIDSAISPLFYWWPR